METTTVKESTGALAGVMSPTIERVLELARTHLQMEVSFLSEFSGGKQIFRAADGQMGSFGLVLGDGPDLPDTYCQQMVAGQIPSAVPDSMAEASLRDLAGTLAGNIGSYIGVPLWLSDGSLYGTFCCLGHKAESLDARDVGFMSMLAEVLVKELDAQQQTTRKRTYIAGILDTESVTIAFQPIIHLRAGHRGRRGVVTVPLRQRHARCRLQ